MLRVQPTSHSNDNRPGSLVKRPKQKKGVTAYMWNEVLAMVLPWEPK